MADLSEDDPVLAELRSARPEVDDAHTDASSATAVALHTRIVQSDPAPADVRVLPHRGRRTRWLTAAAAAAVVAIAAVGIGILGVDGTDPAAASIEDIVAATDEATRGSGRATIRMEQTQPSGTQYLTEGEAAFSGDDVDLVLREEDGRGAMPVMEGRQRVVDGERYVTTLAPLGDEPDWHPSSGIATHEKVFGVDPRVLLEVLGDEAGFTVVGDEEVDGRPVTHLRATSPEAVDAPNIAQGQFAAIESLTGLDLWVGDDDVVYRLDMTVTRDEWASEITYVDEGDPCPEASTAVPVNQPPDYWPSERGKTACLVEHEPHLVDEAYEIRFHDLGTPVTIEPPANVGPPFPQQS